MCWECQFFEPPGKQWNWKFVWKLGKFEKSGVKLCTVFDSEEGDNFWLELFRGLKHWGFKELGFHCMWDHSHIYCCSNQLTVRFSSEWTREVAAKLLFFSPAPGIMMKDSHLRLMSQTIVCAIEDLIYDYKHLMTWPCGTQWLCFAETLGVLQGKAEGNIKSWGETNLAVFLWGLSLSGWACK